MSEQDPIDQSKMIGGRRAMTQSHREERQRGHIPKRGRGTMVHRCVSPSDFATSFGRYSEAFK